MNFFSRHFMKFTTTPTGLPRLLVLSILHFILLFFLALPLSASVTFSNARRSPRKVEDKNGHILPYVKFEGGALKLADEALAVLGALP